MAALLEAASINEQLEDIVEALTQCILARFFDTFCTEEQRAAS